MENNMTIFCWDGKHLAVDKEEYKLGVRVKRTHKYREFSTDLYKRIIIVGAGSVALLQHMFDAIEGCMRDGTAVGQQIYGEQFDNLISKSDDFDVMVLTQDLGDVVRAYTVSYGLHFNLLEAPYAGGHSDAVLCAMGAMHAGATAEEALKIACDLTLIAKITTSDDYDIL